MEDIEDINELSFWAVSPDSASWYQTDGTELLRTLVVMKRCFTCFPPWLRKNMPQHCGCNPDKNTLLILAHLLQNIVKEYVFEVWPTFFITNKITCKAKPL